MEENNIISAWIGSEMEKIFSGSSPFNDGTELTILKEPRQSFPIPEAPESPGELSPGLDPELQELADALTAFKEKMSKPKKTAPAKKTAKKK